MNAINNIGGVGTFIPASSAHIVEMATNMQADSARIEALEQAARTYAHDPVALKEATNAFESFFLQIMFREMRRTVMEAPEGSLFARSNAERIFRDMLDEEVSIMAANSGGIGLSAFIFRQMQREGTFM